MPLNSFHVITQTGIMLFFFSQYTLYKIVQDIDSSLY